MVVLLWLAAAEASGACSRNSDDGDGGVGLPAAAALRIRDRQLNRRWLQIASLLSSLVLISVHRDNAHT